MRPACSYTRSLQRTGLKSVLYVLEHGTVFQFSYLTLSISRLHKKILDAATEPEPVRLVTKPYANGVVPFQSRSAKLVERFTELYKTDRVHIMNSLKGMPDNSTAERLVFLIAEVRLLQAGICIS